MSNQTSLLQQLTDYIHAIPSTLTWEYVYHLSLFCAGKDAIEAPKYTLIPVGDDMYVYHSKTNNTLHIVTYNPEDVEDGAPAWATDAFFPSPETLLECLYATEDDVMEALERPTPPSPLPTSLLILLPIIQEHVEIPSYFNTILFLQMALNNPGSLVPGDVVCTGFVFNKAQDTFFLIKQQEDGRYVVINLLHNTIVGLYEVLGLALAAVNNETI